MLIHPQSQTHPQVIYKTEGLTERGKAMSCGLKVAFSPSPQYRSLLPNQQEKWLVLSRETKSGTSWLYVFQRGMFPCTFTP